MENETEATCYQPTKFFICGIVMEVIGSVGIAWSILVLYVLWRYGHIKSNVTYIPICSLIIATCGQLFLVVLHVAPDMMDRSANSLNKDFNNFMFFPFWYAVLSSVWLMAANRCAVAFSTSRARKIFTRRLMFVAASIGWALGVCIGCAAYAEGVLENMVEGDFDSGVVNCSMEAVHGHVHAFNWLFHSNRSAVLTTTQTFDCLTLVIVAACYVFVIYRLKFRGLEIADQLNGHQIAPPQVLPSSSRRATMAVPLQPGTTSFPTRRFSVAVAPARQNILTPSASQDSSNVGIPNVDVGTLWFVTLQFGLLSLSVGLFALFILLGNVQHSSELLLAMEILYPTTSLLNILLVSLSSRKIQSELAQVLTAPWRCVAKPVLEIKRRYREEQEKRRHKPPVVVISRAENSRSV